MILSASDLALEIDFGRNQPGAFLQRKVIGRYQDYLIDGKPVVNPIDARYCRRGGIGYARSKPRPCLTGTSGSIA